ncbi:MAG: nitrilase family protein [Saprospiraceae bacterium]|nr:nitrilase family protein [Saprospiraceae bacterium]
MKSDLIVTLIQFDPVWEDPPRNRNKLDTLLSDHDQDADLLVLPEMFSTGFTMNAPSMAEVMEGETIQWLADKALSLNADIVGSLIVREKEQYYNRLIWMGPGGIKAIYDKRHLFGLAGEDKIYTSGKNRITVELKGWRLSPFICYDLRFPVWCRNEHAVDAIIYIACFPEKRHYAWQQLLLSRAIENQCYVIGVNRIGWDGEGHYYAGDSVVVDPLGKPLIKLGDQELLRNCTLNDNVLEVVRYEQPFLQDRDEFEIKL